MSDIVIKAEKLGKKYIIGHQAERDGYTALRDVLMQNARILWSKTKDLATGKPIIEGDTREEVWALKDVSFEIHRGEAMGIIGRNGAGKSTLLKILSRITEPTTGRVTIKGRVASLLEVGTGFHPELTGRENIYLNGTILGMIRKEIRQKFDEIVSFAEVEKYLDTPVKRYSSGMYVRLAFAVAAHLEPEILVVDEVLAVGDAAFQKKCLGKMGEVSHEGRTVLFVSHNMAAIQRLCSRAIVLNQGEMVLDDNVDKAITYYMGHDMQDSGERVWTETVDAPGNDVVRLLSIRLRNDEGNICDTFDVCHPVNVEIKYRVTKPAQLSVCLEFINAMGINIMVTFDNYALGPWGKQLPYQPGLYMATCRIPGDLLTEDQISINLRIYSPPEQPNDKPHVRIFEVIYFNVFDSMDPGGVRGYFPYNWGTPALRPRLNWTTERIPDG
jgi:lipopolysaccharide transport system ATP-binding protein